MKLFNILVSSACGISAGGPLSLRRLDGPTPFAFPANCTAEKKPDSEAFCALGTLSYTPGLKVNMTVYLFDAKETTKSTHFHIEMALNGSQPAGLNITGGGCANVVDKEFAEGLLEGSVELCTETVGDGRGKLDEKTGNWNAEVQVKATAEASVFGKSFTLPVTKVVQAHIGPNYDFGLDASFQKSTGDERNEGLGIVFDLTMNTKDHSLFTWELIGAVKLHVWWHPLFDKEPEVKLFHKDFNISLG
ncbi:hypothetical protein FOL47_006517 [Perkinsus chesapeaki]|uniref:Uncharacterized protein n=1 Tax=Perkinsus chesapeaki TaxID=330153 RepID=A0A7J6LRG3_PERCH|nr:hypothetical protein FOL47_006517 [Perkinsus chesapeaki]